MRRSFFLTPAILALALGAPCPAVGLSFSGTLSIQYTTEALLSISGSGISVDGPAGAFDLPAGVFAGDDGPVSTPIAAPALVAAELQDVLTGAGSFAAGAGTMSVGGDLLHYYLDDSPTYLTLIPLSDVGVGGTQALSGFFSTGTVTGSPWTTGAINVVGSGEPLNASGFDARALDGTGAIRFVTPISVVLQGTVVAPGYAQLDLVFVPEPGALQFVGLGLALLAATRNKARRRPSAG